MSADVRLGSPYRAGFEFRNVHGSPVTSGVTGAVSLYGPGATASIAGPQDPPTHLGGGVWGMAIAASLLATPGLYRLAAPALTDGTVTYGQQDRHFVVGPASAVYRTLRECIVGLAIELDAGLAGTATGGSTTTLVDSGRANSNLGASEWVDSEILILEPASATDRNPVTVTAFTPASGTFTFAAIGNAVTSGTDYLLLNLRGRGVSYGKLLGAILAAWRDVGPAHQVADEVNFTTDATYRLAVPSQWRAIDGVQVRWGTSGPWSDIAEAYRPHDPALGYLNFARAIGANQQLRLVGRLAAPEPSALTDVVQVPYGWLRDRVLGELLAQGSRADQQRAAIHLQRAERFRPRG